MHCLEAGTAMGTAIVIVCVGWVEHAAARRPDAIESLLPYKKMMATLIEIFGALVDFELLMARQLSSKSRITMIRRK